MAINEHAKKYFYVLKFFYGREAECRVPFMDLSWLSMVFIILLWIFHDQNLCFKELNPSLYWEPKFFRAQSFYRFYTFPQPKFSSKNIKKENSHIIHKRKLLHNSIRCNLSPIYMYVHNSGSRMENLIILK